jgi:RNA polymerase sigma factor (sigma-70 family)
MAEADEYSLICRAQKGDERAFGELLRLYYDRIYAMACSYCLNRDLAQDITQEVCLSLAKNIRSFQHNSAFLTWVYRITINTAKNMFISARRRQNYEYEFSREVAQYMDAGVQDAIEHRQELKRIHNLPEAIRETVLLVYVEGLTHKDAAKILGCAEMTIAWRIFKGRKILKENQL